MRLVRCLQSVWKRSLRLSPARSCRTSICRAARRSRLGASIVPTKTDILHLKALRALIDRLGDEPERALPHLHTLQSLLPDNDLADEIARINDQARLTVAAAPDPEVARRLDLLAGRPPNLR